MLGWTLLKMKSFPTVQIAQHIRIVTIMKKSRWDWHLICSTASVILRSGGIPILIWFQQSLANWQCRNKCSVVSSTDSWQSTQLYESRCIIFLLSTFLILRRSFTKSQSALADRNIPITICTLGICAYAPWDVCKFLRLKICPTEDSSYLLVHLEGNDLWRTEAHVVVEMPLKKVGAGKTQTMLAGRRT